MHSLCGKYHTGKQFKGEVNLQPQRPKTTFYSTMCNLHVETEGLVSGMIEPIWTTVISTEEAPQPFHILYSGIIDKNF